ncbi:MAG TPA: hypothetical protein VE821_04120 [Pyrinomonadaceae bacterium]|nr:hypothetical protein [Pyrinomonadaceae bacterium]
MNRNANMIRSAILIVCALACAASVNAQKASTSFKTVPKDPFIAWRPVPKKRPRNVPVQVDPPPIQARINAYKAQKAAAMNMQLPAPKPTTALLLSEVQLTGIFRTPRGYAATVEATPIKLSFVIYPGERFFDGMLVAIEENRLVCRKETRWSDGRRELNVDFKPLGQPNVVKDAMTATAPAPNEQKSEPAKAEPAKADPAKAEPAKAQPAKAEESASSHP